MRAHVLSVILLLSVFVGCVSEPEASDPVVCNSPYIRYESGCCLDRDDNLICDVDETTSTRRTTTSAAVTSSSTSTSTTTTTTTTSTTSTTTRILPVTERAFKAHITESDGYQELLRKYGQERMLMGVLSLPYDEAKDSLKRMRDRGHDDCGGCYDFSGGTLWGSEFGANRSKTAYAYMVDRETGTGAMYRYIDGDFDECWCETI